MSSKQMTPEQICKWLNATRAPECRGVWIPWSVVIDGVRTDVYGCSEGGKVGKGRYLLADEAMRIATRTAAEAAAKGDGG